MKSLELLREEVLEANLELVRRELVLYTFGNASGIARDEGLVVIKPSGIPYDKMRPEHLVVTDLSGKVVEGHLRPSSDLPTHVALYNAFPQIGGVAHTHSEYATAWAQAGRDWTDRIACRSASSFVRPCRSPSWKRTISTRVLSSRTRHWLATTLRAPAY